MKTHPHFFRQSNFMALYSFFEGRRCFRGGPESSGYPQITDKMRKEWQDFSKTRTPITPITPTSPVNSTTVTQTPTVAINKPKPFATLRKTQIERGVPETEEVMEKTVERLEGLKKQITPKAKLNPALIATLSGLSDAEFDGIRRLGANSIFDVSSLGSMGANLQALGLSFDQFLTLIEQKTRGNFLDSGDTIDGSDIINLMVNNVPNIKNNDKVNIVDCVKNILNTVYDLRLNPQFSALKNVVQMGQNRSVDSFNGQQKNIARIADFQDDGKVAVGYTDEDHKIVASKTGKEVEVDNANAMEQGNKSYLEGGLAHTLYQKAKQKVLKAGITPMDPQFKDKVNKASELVQGELENNGSKFLNTINTNDLWQTNTSVLRDMAKGTALESEFRDLDDDEDISESSKAVLLSTDDKTFLARLGAYAEKASAGQGQINPTMEQQINHPRNTETENYGVNDLQTAKGVYAQMLQQSQAAGAVIPSESVLVPKIAEAIHSFSVGGVHNTVNGKTAFGAGYSMAIKLTDRLTLNLSAGVGGQTDGTVGGGVGVGLNFALVNEKNVKIAAVANVGIAPGLLGATAGVEATVFDRVHAGANVGFNPLNGDIMGFNAHLGVEVWQMQNFINIVIVPDMNAMLKGIATLQYNPETNAITATSNGKLDPEMVSDQVDKAFAEAIKRNEGTPVSAGIDVTLGKLMLAAAVHPLFAIIGSINVALNTGVVYKTFDQRHLAQVTSNILADLDGAMQNTPGTVQKKEFLYTDANGEKVFAKGSNPTVEYATKTLGWKAMEKQDTQKILLQPDVNPFGLGTTLLIDPNISGVEWDSAHKTLSLPNNTPYSIVESTNKTDGTQRYIISQGTQPVSDFGAERSETPYRSILIPPVGSAVSNGVAEVKGQNDHYISAQNTAYDAANKGYQTTAENYDVQTLKGLIPKGSPLDKEIHNYYTQLPGAKTRSAIFTDIKNATGRQNLSDAVIARFIAQRETGDFVNVKTEDKNRQERVLSGGKTVFDRNGFDPNLLFGHINYKDSTSNVTTLKPGTTFLTYVGGTDSVGRKGDLGRTEVVAGEQNYTLTEVKSFTGNERASVVGKLLNTHGKNGALDELNASLKKMGIIDNDQINTIKPVSYTHLTLPTKRIV